MGKVTFGHFIAGVVLLLLFSCSRYGAIKNHPPLRYKDSVILAERYLKTFPAKPSVKTKDTTVTEIRRGKPTGSFKPNLPVITPEIETQYQDTCTSIIQKYKDALAKGYTNGFFDGRESLEPDTLEITKTITREITITNDGQLLIANDRATKAEAAAAKAKAQAKTRQTVIYYLLGLILLIGIITYFLIKRKR